MAAPVKAQPGYQNHYHADTKHGLFVAEPVAQSAGEEDWHDHYSV